METGTGRYNDDVVCLTKKLYKWCLLVMLSMKKTKKKKRYHGWGREGGRLYNGPGAESFYRFLCDLT